ncbi:hypothetical protein FQN54_001772 [Arachnomyces sp. PD_36]|nr:hypothetical protein FQN54_001772 [Arachnomyces sp. PD_36]
MDDDILDLGGGYKSRRGTGPDLNKPVYPLLKTTYKPTKLPTPITCHPYPSATLHANPPTQLNHTSSPNKIGDPSTPSEDKEGRSRLCLAFAAPISRIERKSRMRRRIWMLNESFEESVVRAGALETVKEAVVGDGR